MADGEAVDWQAVEHRRAGARESAILANLKLLDGLAAAASASSPAGRSSAARLRPPPYPWPLRLAILLAAVQVPVAVMLAVVSLPPPGNVPWQLVLATVLVFAAAAAALLWTGGGDARSRPLAGFFLVIASAASLFFLPSPRRAAATAGVLQGLAALPPECFLPYFLWCFVESFPRLLHQGRWSALLRTGRRLSGLAGGTLFFVNVAVRFLGRGPFPPGWIEALLPLAGSLYWLILFALALPAPVVGYLRSREAPEEERRRVRFFVGGLAAGMLPLLLAVVLESALPAFKLYLDRPRVRAAASFLVYLPLLTIPVTTSYAVVAQRLLDLRLIVHRAARWSLARGTLWSLALLPWLVLAVALWRGRERPLGALLATEPAPLLLGLGVLGALLLLLRRRLLHRLEQRLLGRREHAGPVLASFHQQLAALRDLGELEASLRRHAADLVQSESARLLVHDQSRAVWVPASGPATALLADTSAVVRLAAAASEPLSLDPRDRDSFLPWIPEHERLWAADAEVQLVGPVASTSGEPAALLCLGPARSGLPYDGEERQSLAALASAAALVLERLRGRPGSPAGGPGPEPEETPTGECRDCGRVAPSPGGACACGGRLEPATLPFRLAGKFRLQGILGQGGMGLVYLARDLGLDRLVALKTLPRLRSDALLRLRQEARSMARFIHPGVALIFGVETWRGVPVLVVEYLAGGSLDQRLRQEPWDIVEAVGLVQRVAEALAAVHEQGLLHRDVKPSNIGFTAAGQPKLLDFGLARLVEEARIAPELDLDEVEDVAPRLGANLTRTSRMVGTPLYLSPEALRGAPPSAALDLWSLWLVLWEVLGGRHPLLDRPLKDALRALRRGEIPDIRQQRPSCPPPLAVALAAGLHPDPARRPATAAAVAEELRELAGGLA